VRIEDKNHELQIPEPPSVVYAFGEDEKATIWWDFPVPVPSSSSPIFPPLPPYHHPKLLLKEGFGEAHFMQFSMERTSIINEMITGWEILRYRYDHKTGDWALKGHTLINDHKEVFHCRYTITGLQNDSMYCFAVYAINSRGKSLLSERSHPTVVDKPLPFGWYRVMEPKPDPCWYYTSPALSISTRVRPDNDPK